MEASHASGVQLVDAVGLGCHLLNGSGEACRCLKGQLGGRWGVSLGCTMLCTDAGGVGAVRITTVVDLGPVLGQPHCVCADVGLDVIKPVVLHPLGKRTVSLVQAAAITEGFTDVTPRLALLGGGGLDVGPGAWRPSVGKNEP